MKNPAGKLAGRLKRALAEAGISTRFSSELLANVISFGGMAVVGVLLNFLIARRYSVAALGVYNQVYSIYLFLSQLAVGGVHLSVLKTIAEKELSQEEEREIFSPAFLLTFLTALPVALLALVGRGAAADLVQSPGVKTGIACVVPGLIFFSLNKVLLAELNARRKMLHFAAFQAVRAALMLSAALVLFRIDSSGMYLPSLFTLTETLLFFLVLPFVWRSIGLREMARGGRWLKKHLAFGVKAMPGNLLMNTYNKFDVLILGIFAGDAVVGIYSLAAMLLDGYLQLGVVFRNNVNPVLARKFRDLPPPAFEAFCRRIRNYSFIALGAVGILAAAAFPLLGMVFKGVDVAAAWGAFAVLMGGAVISQGYMPLTLMLNQCGKPGAQSAQITLVFVTIILLNFSLAPRLGLMGAAIATSLTYFLQVVYLKFFISRALSIRV